MVSLLWCGEGSSLKGNQQLVMNPQEHNRSWKVSAMCLLVCVGVCWYVVWCGAVVCRVVDCLLLRGRSSSLRCWLCQFYRQCTGCFVVYKHDMSRQ